MRKRAAFSLVELLVAIMVTVLVLFFIGSLSSLGERFFIQGRQEIALMNDLVYSFRMAQNHIRSAKTVVRQAAPGGVWYGERLDVDSGAFGIQSSGGTERELVFCPDRSAPSTKDVLLSSAGGDLSWMITCVPVDCAGDPLIEIRLQGSREGTVFDLTNGISRRVYE